MRLSVNHVAEIYVTEQRQRARVEKSYQKQTNVLWRFWRNGTQLYFAILTWLGAPKRRHAGNQTTIARPILTTSKLLGQFWKEERQPNLMTIVTLYNRTGWAVPCDAKRCWQRDRCRWRVRRTRNMLANKWRQRHECARQIYSSGDFRNTKEWRVWWCLSCEITA